jgi:hypothetical protein
MLRSRFHCLRLLTVLVLAGCGGDSPTPTDVGGNLPDAPDPLDPSDEADPSSPFECERVGFPCSWADVDPAAAEASVELGRELLEMLDGGQTVAQALAFLEGRSDVVHAVGSEVAIRFRLEGGRPTWVLGPGAIRVDHDGASASAAMALSVASHRSPSVHSTPARVVVGDEPKAKRALVISPYQWDFGASDEGAHLAEVLAGVRGYEDGVQYRGNAVQGATDVTWEDFQGWDHFDVVHVSTHGVQICEDAAECYTVLLVGDVAADETTSSSVSDLDLVIWEVDDQGFRSLGVSTDFLRRAYPGGLSDTIVFFNACQTALGEDLEMALAGPGSAVLGWTESVFSNTGYAAALAFYDNLNRVGYGATVAYEELGELAVDSVEAGEGLAILSIYPGDDSGPRLREIVYPRNPSNGQDLPTTEPYPIIGTFDDGVPDRIPFDIKIDGVQADPSDFVVHVQINGFSADPIPLSEGQAIDGEANEWRVQGEVLVPFDARPGEEIEVRARVTLPEGGGSEWYENATLGELSICQFTVTVGGSSAYVAQPGDVAEYFAYETGDADHPYAVAYVNFETQSGRMALFAVDIAESLVTGPGSYPVPEIGGTIGYDGAPYATYGDDGATLEVFEFQPHTVLRGEIFDGTVHDSSDPDGPTLSISAEFDIRPEPGPFYGTASCQVGQ